MRSIPRQGFPIRFFRRYATILILGAPFGYGVGALIGFLSHPGVEVAERLEMAGPFGLTGLIFGALATVGGLVAGLIRDRYLTGRAITRIWVAGLGGFLGLAGGFLVAGLWNLMRDGEMDPGGALVLLAIFGPIVAIFSAGAVALTELFVRYRRPRRGEKVSMWASGTPILEDEIGMVAPRDRSRADR